MAINPEEFGASFQGFIEQMTAQKKPADAPFFVQKLREHFGSEPSKLPILSESFAKHDHPNLHMAMEDYLARDGCSAQVMGVVGLHAFMGQGLSESRSECAMARALEPSIVVLEDVDLIAEERTKGGSGCATPLLFTKSLLGFHSRLGFGDTTRNH